MNCAPERLLRMPYPLQAKLEKQLKELNVRIVDLETKSYANPSHPSATVRQLEARIEELTKQLNQASTDKRHSTQLRSPDKAAREVHLQLSESERQRAKLEDDKKAANAQVQALREKLDKVVCILAEIGRSPRSTQP